MKIAALFFATWVVAAQTRPMYFPPAGESMDSQQRISLSDAGIDAALIDDLKDAADRWALWKDGRLVHVKGDFNLGHDVASNRKTWHAMIVGAAIQQGKIPSINQKINVWTKDLKGNDAEAAWRHVITQSAGLDYPYGDYPDFAPGKMWTYSDLNLVQLCRGLARVFGRKDYNDDYASVAKQAYFDAIGMRGWKTVIKKDPTFSGPDDGVRFVFDLEDMGRLGLLALNKGNWNGKQLVPAWFVEELERKQTRGMLANYNGPNDGDIAMDPKVFPEAPYGFLTWVNTDGDLLPGADRGWAYASGAGGFKTYWNRRFGIVLAAGGAKRLPRERDIPRMVEARLLKRSGAVRQWEPTELSFEAAKQYANPYLEASMTAEFRGPNGAVQKVYGFWDGGQSWKIRWTPQSAGTWTYKTASADAGLGGKGGELRAEPPAAGSRGFLRRDARHSYSFVFDNGERYFHFGNTFYGLLSNAMAGDKWKRAIDATREIGMNKVRFSPNWGNASQAMGGYTQTNTYIGDRYNELNVAALQKLDEIVRYAAARGVIADLIVFHRGQVNALDMPGAQQYLRYMMARYAAFPSVIWCLQNEWEYTDKKKDFWIELGRFARTEDPYIENAGNVRGLSVHQQTRYDWQMSDEKWYSHAIVQLGVRNRGKAHRGGDEWNLKGRSLKDVFHYGDDWGHFSIACNYGRNYPVVNDEYGYIGEPQDETEPKTPSGQSVRYTRDKHRRTMWAIYAGGGYASAGNKYDYPDGRPYFSTNWQDAVEWEDVRHLIDFFTTRGIEYWKMKGDQTLVSGTRAYALAEPGRQYVVYAAAGGTVSLQIAGGPFEARRFDPRTGQEAALGRVDAGAREVKLPDDGDWVVYFKPVSK